MIRVTAVQKKFPPGTKFVVQDHYEYPDGQVLKMGDIVTIHKSKKYPRSYDFVGYPDVGWCIEDSGDTMFKLFKWKDVIGGK